jgi:indolepyruvate ferredoxin oxidoreductase
VPPVNEELATNAVLRKQRARSDPDRTCDGVIALWCGKGLGVDRVGEALKQGNAQDSSPHVAVLVVAGGDHACVFSSRPHASDGEFQSWGLPGSHRHAPPGALQSCRADQPCL